jgi:hypothetical protein
MFFANQTILSAVRQALEAAQLSLVIAALRDAPVIVCVFVQSGFYSFFFKRSLVLDESIDGALLLARRVVQAGRLLSVVFSHKNCANVCVLNWQDWRRCSTRRWRRWHDQTSAWVSRHRQTTSTPNSRTRRRFVSVSEHNRVVFNVACRLESSPNRLNLRCHRRQVLSTNKKNRKPKRAQATQSISYQ